MIGCIYNSEFSSSPKRFGSGLNQWPEHPARDAAIALEAYVHTQPAATPTALGLQGTNPKHLQT
jgi:hypothetical protein